MVVENNTIVLVRALVKLSSAIYDIDCMIPSPKHKFQLKKDLEVFQVWLLDYTKEPILNLSTADSELLLDLINLFEEYEKTIFIRTEYFTRVNLFLAKCYSALNDLKQLDHIYSTYVIELTEKLEFILNKPYFKHYKDYQDDNGGTFNNIVEFMDNKGKTIIVGTL
jgi:hypothetical protein